MNKILHGLPEKVIFCKRCVMSNQRPSTTPEHTKSSTDIKTAEFDESGICHACLFSDLKENPLLKSFNWIDDNPKSKITTSTLSFEISSNWLNFT